MFVLAIIVPNSAACRSCGQTSPLAVATGLASPRAVTPTITILPAKSAGKSTAECDVLTIDQSIQTRPKLSVATGPNCGIRIFSTPFSFILTWNVESPAATRSVSIAKLGYNFPSTAMISGARRTTPSISGNVLIIPTPAAADSNTAVLAMMPG